jgi:multiple antibiotic resistance protein
MPEIVSLTKFVVALLAIMNPLVASMLLLALTPGQSMEQRRHVAAVAAVTVGVTLLVTLLAGEQVLELLNIHVPTFRVAGGVIIFLAALSMLHAGQDRAERASEGVAEATGEADVAIFPLAIPMIAGPGAIITVLTHSHLHEGLAATLGLCGGILAAVAATWLALRFAGPLGAWLGTTGTNVTTRVERRGEAMVHKSGPVAAARSGPGV